MDIWSKPTGMLGPDAPDYWEYFGARFVEHAGVGPGMSVLDVGCGRGEFLELLRQNDVKGEGIDSDPEMIHLCVKRNLKAFNSSARDHLSL